MTRPLAAALVLALTATLTACSEIEPLTVTVEQRAGAPRIIPLEIDGECFWESRSPDAPPLPLELGTHPAALDLTGPQPILTVRSVVIPLEPGSGCR